MRVLQLKISYMLRNAKLFISLLRRKQITIRPRYAYTNGFVIRFLLLPYKNCDLLSILFREMSYEIRFIVAPRIRIAEPALILISRTRYEGLRTINVCIEVLEPKQPYCYCSKVLEYSIKFQEILTLNQQSLRKAFSWTLDFLTHFCS